MLLAKRLPWILLGLTLGIGTGIAPRVVAQEGTSSYQELIDHPAAGGTGNNLWFFVSDSKTHSCWLSARSRAGGPVTALAPAPPEACR